MNANLDLQFFRRLLPACFAVALCACGSSGAGSSGDDTIAGDESGCIPSDPSTAGDCGNVIVALTDLEGGFSSYTVDVQSISLERDDGALIDLLPEPARVDFAQLTTLSELIATAAVVPGEFIGGTIRIDYGDAEIFVDAGDAIVPANVYDREGRLLTETSANSAVELAIRLPDRERLAVARNRTVLLSIDFDLAASHIIDTTTAPVSVVVEPYLVAEVQPVDAKEVRVRGTLVAVDLVAGTYDIALRPWLHRSGDYGAFTVATHEDTEFEIDGIAYVGTAGLEALADKPRGTLTVAFGVLGPSDRRFTADVVHAGDSVGGDRFSAVLGNIVSRDGDRLVMKGAIAIARDRRAHFRRTVVVDIGPDTQVTRRGSPGTEFDKDDLSVGQRAMVFGEFTNATAEDTDLFGPDVPLMLDATQGRVRMLVTRLLGTVTAVFPDQINIGLRGIDHLSAGLFDFSGTGVAPGYDADPTDYEVLASNLELGSLEISKSVVVLGFVVPFGEAPPDFGAIAVVGPRDLPAAIGVGWGIEGTASPFSVMAADSLVVDLANPDIGQRHHLLIGDRLVDLFDLPASPGITESEPPRVYGIAEPGHVELFKDFADFVDELGLKLSAGSHARSLAAYGRYDEGEAQLTANKIVVHMRSADVP